MFAPSLGENSVDLYMDNTTINAGIGTISFSLLKKTIGSLLRVSTLYQDNIKSLTGTALLGSS